MTTQKPPFDPQKHQAGAYSQPQSNQPQQPYQQPSAYQAQQPYQQPSAYQTQQSYQQPPAYQAQQPYQQQNYQQQSYQQPSYDPYQAQYQNRQSQYGPVGSRDKTTALLLAIFLGGLGGHQFYVGKTGMGILYIFTGGLLGIGVIIDIINIATGKFTDAEGYYLRQ